MSVNNDYNQALQNALSGLAKEYKQLESWISEIEKDEKDIQYWSQHLENKYAYTVSDGEGDHYTTYRYTTNHNATQAIWNDGQDMSNVLNQIAQADQQADGTSPFANLANAIQECLGTINTLISQFGTDLADDIDSRVTNAVSEDLTMIFTVLSTLVTALKEKVTTQQDEDELNLMNQDGASFGDISALALKLIGDETQESTTFQNLNSKLEGDLSVLQKQYNQADNDENGIHWWDYILFWNEPWVEKSEDETIKQNATMIMSLIGDIMGAIVPEIACLLPDFVQIEETMQMLLKKLTEILHSHLSPAERDKEIMKLNSEIMALFVQVIGLLSLVEQDASKKKGDYEAMMSKATSFSAKMNISNSAAEAKKIEQDQEFAREMQFLMTFCKYLLEAIFVVAAPGLGSFLVAVAILALDASGLLDKMTDAMAKSIESHKTHGHNTLGKDASKDVAEGIVAALEIIATLGGGAAMDAILSSVMQSITESIAAQITKTVATEAIEAGTKVIAEAIDDVAGQMAKPTLELAAKKAAEQAAKKVFSAMIEQNGMSVAWKLLKEAVSQFTSAVERPFEEAMMVAAKEAAENAVEESAAWISLFKDIDGATADRIQELVATIAENAGNVAAAKVLKMSAMVVSQIVADKTSKDLLKDAGRRAIYSALYAIGANNVLVDMIKAINESDKMKDGLYDTLLGFMQALQALMMMLGQIAGSGMLSQMTTDTSRFMSMMNKAVNLAVLGGTATESLASIEQAEIDWKEAAATVAMVKIQTALNVFLQLVTKQMSAQSKQESKHDNADFVEQMKSNFSVAAHTYDYLNTASQVMIAG